MEMRLPTFAGCRPLNSAFFFFFLLVRASVMTYFHDLRAEPERIIKVSPCPVSASPLHPTEQYPPPVSYF